MNQSQNSDALTSCERATDNFESGFEYLYLQKKIGQSGGASRWRVCYQRGLPRLVLRV